MLTARVLVAIATAVAAFPAAVSRASDNAVAAREVPSAEDATFWKHVMPIFKERCIGCHGGERPKGRLDLESFEGLAAGGKKGDVLGAGAPEESRLFQLVARTRKPFMPPKDEDPLREDQVLTIRAWIEGGAREGTPVDEVEPYSLPLEPPVYTRPPAITALAYSADGERLFVSGYREIVVHDVGEGMGPETSLRSRLVGEAERILALAVSPDGKTLAAVGGSPARFGEVQLWDLSVGRLARYVRIGKDTLFALAYSPDGSRLAVGGTDRSIHLLDARTGEELYSSEIHSDWIFGLGFSSDGTRLASAARDKTVKVSQAEDGKFLKTLTTFSAPVFRLAGRPGAAMCLVGGEAKQPVLFDLEGLKEVRKYEEQPGAILAAAFSSDGALFAVGGSGSEIRVYQADDGALRAKLPGQDEWVYALAFSPDGSRLAAAGYDGVVRIHDVGGEARVVAFVPVPVAGGAPASSEEATLRKF